MDDLETMRERYFSELDPEARREILDQYEKGDPPCAGLLEALWSKRYADPKNPGRRVDLFLWQIMNLIYLCGASGFFSRNTANAIGGAMKSLGFAEAAEYGEEGREILYLEFRNAARRYLYTCKDQSYGAKLMGLVKAGDAERIDKTAGDIWLLTKGLPERSRNAPDMGLFSKAVYDEFLAQYPNGTQLLDAQGKRRGKR